MIVCNTKLDFEGGYQIEVDPSDRAWSGGLYEPGNRGWVVTLAGNEPARKSFKPMDWNRFKIVMDGNKIQTWVNGILVVDTTHEMSASGFLGLQTLRITCHCWQKIRVGARLTSITI